MLKKSAALYCRRASAVTGTQAADVPQKATTYVKVCNLYGDGFYYIPNTEIRLSSVDTAAGVCYNYGQNVTSTPFFGRHQ